MTAHNLGPRLEAIRESLGLSVIEASKRLGFPSYQTLRKIEAGEREVKVSEIAKFAKVYFCSISKLLGKDEIEPTYSFLWRNPPQPEPRKEIESTLFNLCEQYHMFEKLLNLRTERGLLEVSIDDIKTNNSINSLANKYKDLFGLGNRPAFTLEKVLEQDYGVKILFYPLYHGSAACMVHSDLGGAIVINSNEAPWRCNYDLAHELFHLVTWAAISPKDLTDQSFFEEIERKADRFASMLLLPENEVRKEISKRIESQNRLTLSDIVDIAIDFGVSAKALLYRLAYLHLTDWETADKIAKDENLRDLSKEKRSHEWKTRPISEHFFSLAIRCLRKGLISRGKFAEIIGIDRSEIDDFIEDKGLMEAEGSTIEIMAS